VADKNNMADPSADTPMYCTKCKCTVQQNGKCAKGGIHHLISISDKGVQGQGNTEGPESTKNKKPSDPNNYHEKRGFLARVADRFNPIRSHAMQYVAHDSGDGQTIFHCFGGDTKYWTRDGLKTLADTVDTVQEILTASESGVATWQEARIFSGGEQQLYAINLQRNKRTKTIYATSGHRWLVRNSRDTIRSVITTDLKKNDRLAFALPKPLAKQSTPSTFGIAHGVVFGDGTANKYGSLVRLWGDKDEQLLPYFNNSETYREKTPNGVLGWRVTNLPRSFKSYPSLDEGVSYLYGWLAGYFAADGSVTKDGQAILCSAQVADLEFAQMVAVTILGISTYDIVAEERQGYGDEPSTLYSMQFVNSTLDPDFFLIEDHRQRFEQQTSRANYERMGWTVVAVEATDRIEEVFCPYVHNTENFVLDGFINTGNCPFCGSGQVVGRSDGTVECDFCGTCFTVQVQPEHMGMPQTINGIPYQMPGMPAGQDPNEASGLVSPADDQGPPGQGDQPQDPGEQDPDGSQLGSPQDEEDQDPSKDSAPWMRQSKKVYLTHEGVLPQEEYMRHLAIHFADNRDEVIGVIRSER